MKKIKIWHIYDVNGSTVAPDTDLEYNFGSSSEAEEKTILKVLKDIHARKDLIDLFVNNKRELLKSDYAGDASDEEGSVYISQEVADFH